MNRISILIKEVPGGQLKSQSDVTPVPWTQTRGSPRPGDRGEASPPGVAR